MQLNQILHLDAVGGSVVVESGMTLQRLEQEVNKHGLTSGIDLAARGTATIGGMVATNAGGIEAFRNGVMRHRVLGLEAVLADGRVMSDLKRVIKANEGYDLKQLFIGAEGTLGVVTKVVLSLLPKQTGTVTALVSCENAALAVDLFRQIHQHQYVNLLSAEAMWQQYARTVAKQIGCEAILGFDSNPDSIYVLLEVSVKNANEHEKFESVLMELLEHKRLTNAVVAKNEKERNAMWRIREDSFVVDDAYPNGFWFDISVPLDQLAEYSEKIFPRIAAISEDLKVFLFAHLGDGNFHATVTAGYPVPELSPAVSEVIYQDLEAMGGSFSAEHGIGVEKRDSLQKFVSTEQLEIMQQLKSLLDPNNIMNPGKVI